MSGIGILGDTAEVCKVLELRLMTGTGISGDTAGACQVLELRLMASTGVLGDAGVWHRHVGLHGRGMPKSRVAANF